jgi:hypothetical protein
MKSARDCSRRTHKTHVLPTSLRLSSERGFCGMMLIFGKPVAERSSNAIPREA